MGFKIRILIAVLTTTLMSCAVHAQKPYPERIQWWADARFGMFIHWGPVSLKAAEISWARANSKQFY